MILIFAYTGLYGKTPTLERYHVKGRITDSTGNAVAYAHIMFGNSIAAHSQFVLSDSSGNFSMALTEGIYTLAITHIAYNDLINKQVDISSDTCFIWIMSKNICQLDDVVVSASFIKHKGAEYTAKVRGNPLAKDRSVLSFMNQLPGVRGLSVNSKSATVYINGRELKMPADEIVRYLASIPTESIDAVTVRSSKGAASKAQSGGSVINITLRKNTEAMYSGQASATASYTTPYSAFQGDASGSFGYFDNRLSSLAYISFYGLSNDMSVTESFLQDSRETETTSHNLYALNLDYTLFYDINDKHSVGVGLNVFGKPSENNFSSYGGEISNPFTKNSTIAKHREELFFNYKYTFGKRKSSFNLKADIMNDWNSYSETYRGLEDVEDNFHKSSQLNYGLSAGLKLEVTDDSELSVGLDYVSSYSKRKYVPAFEDRLDTFLYSEGILGAYAEFYTPLFDDRFDITLGLRYEHYFNRSTELSDRVSFKRRKKDDIFPVLDLSWYFDRDGYNLNLSYDRAVYRPSASEYAPSISRDGEHIYSVDGFLPIAYEYSNSVSLSQLFDNRHTLGISYEWVKDGYDMTFANKGDNVITTYASMGVVQNVSLFFMSRFWIVPEIMYANLYAAGKYTNINDRTSVEEQYGGNASLSLSFYLPKSWSIGISGRYSTPERTVSYTMSENWGAGLTVSKRFGKRGNWSMSLRGELKNGRLAFESTVPDVKFSNEMRMGNGSVTLSLIYKFNDFLGKKTSNIREVRSRGLK